MKKTLLTILVLALAISVSAQKRTNKTDKQVEKVAIGIKLGGNLSQFHYYPDPYDLNKLDFDSLGKRLNPMFGLNVEIPLLKGVVYVSPEVLFNVRGDSRLFESKTFDTLVRYQAKVNYLELRVPVAIAIPVTKTFKPYVFAAPSFSLALPAVGPFKSEIRQYSLDKAKTFDEKVDVNPSNMTKYDYGIALGLGFRFRFDFPGFAMLMKIEGGYYNGMKDTFSEKEHLDQSTAVNAQAYNLDYNRQSRGFEAALTIAIPLGGFHAADDCFYWSDMEKKKNRGRGMFGF